MSEEVSTEVLIIGAGPAGLSAGIYAARSGRKTLILAGKKPSVLETAHSVRNYPGFEEISGPDLLKRMRDHAKAAGATILEEDAIAVMLQGMRMATTREKLIMTDAVIIATGREQKKSLIPGEEQYVGHGLSYCALCDGPLYRQKKVIIYGFDEEAVNDAATLVDMGCEVLLIFPKATEELPPEVQEMLKGDKLAFRAQTAIIEILAGDNGLVRGVKVQSPPDKGEVQEVETNALFIMSHVSSSALLKNAGLSLDEKGHIVVDQDQKTNLEGVFAAGDVTGGLWQVVTAVAEGAKAGVEAAKFVRQSQA